MNTLAALLLTSTIVSFLLTSGLVLTSSAHGRFTMDPPGLVQKFHLTPTPRIGGIGIYFALLLTALFVRDIEAREILQTILLAGLPAIVLGLAEDVTKKIGVAIRLAATVLSGILACWLSSVVLKDVGVPWFDAALKTAPIAIIFTSVAIAGIANSINIIDGFHGLASGTVAICLTAIAFVAASVGDSSLATCCAVVAAAIFGFGLLNFPWGKIFLGDGGAYFAGFALGWLAVLLPARNPGVSPWVSFLICAYPIVEVLYSVVRRRLSGSSPGAADRSHLHSLVATHIVQPRLAGLPATLQNAAVSVIMWGFAAAPAMLALALFRRPGLLVLCVAVFVLSYHVFYRLISSAAATNARA